MNIWFWQLMVSPHMSGLARSLSLMGHNVTFVAERDILDDRAKQGWTLPDLGLVSLIYASTSHKIIQTVRTAPVGSIHICQGIRGNGLIRVAQKELKRLDYKQYVIMETVEAGGFKGKIKNIVYRFLFFKNIKNISGILASGKETKNWLIDRGVQKNKIYPFAYFLPESEVDFSYRGKSEKFRFIYVGRLIELKRVDLLIEAISKISFDDLELVVVGSGPLEASLKVLADKLLPGKVSWIGTLPIDQVRAQMERSDCLVLPSRHDGWGAVISEALMCGTPAVCSDACGAAVIVEASNCGGTFKSGCISSLIDTLEVVLKEGNVAVDKAKKISLWANCLNGASGAVYLDKILSQSNNELLDIYPPWVGAI